jgi:hypothetical protein
MAEIAPALAGTAASSYPARSKMLDVYASDIALLVTEGHCELAERQALAIPHIAVALADARLLSSQSLYSEWCVRWVQPDFGADKYRQWSERIGECAEGAAGVPFTALRRFRLQRQAREVYALMPSRLAEDGNSAHAVTYALLGAQFRWYEQQGRHMPAVQTNLGRLGVLR